jgi:hypothetical protein
MFVYAARILAHFVRARLKVSRFTQIVSDCFYEIASNLMLGIDYGFWLLGKLRGKHPGTAQGITSSIWSQKISQHLA